MVFFLVFSVLCMLPFTHCQDFFQTPPPPPTPVPPPYPTSISETAPVPPTDPTFFVLPNTTSDPKTPECQVGLTLFGSRCFRVFPVSANWTDSETNCVNMGGHLASVHSTEEYNFIQSLVYNAFGYDSPTWLGASDLAQEGVWVWTDGSVFNYSNWWSSSQPDNYLFVEHCLEMNFGGLWNDTNCSIAYPSVCAKCQEGWTLFGSHCFKVFTELATWTDSETNCVNMGGQLASVHSDEEYNFTRSLVYNAFSNDIRTWLGASDAAQEGVWVWTDGSVFDYINWSITQPDNYLNIEHCLEMNFPVAWNDLPCSTEFPSVCSKAFFQTLVPTSAPTPVPPNTTSDPKTPVNVLGLQVRLVSSKDLMASNELDQLLQEVKKVLINNGVPDKFTLRVRHINKISP